MLENAKLKKSNAKKQSKYTRDCLQIDALHLESRDFLTKENLKIPKILLKAQKILLEVNYLLGYAENCYLFGRFNLKMSDFDKSINFFLKSKEIYEKENLLEKLLDCIFYLGESYRLDGKYDKALEELNQGISIFDRVGNINLKGNILSLKATLHYQFSEYLEAIKTLDEVYQIKKSTNDLHGQANTLINIGAIQTDLGNYTLALDSLLKAYEIIEFYLEDHSLESRCLNSLGILYQQMEDHLTAVEYYKKSLNIAIENKDKYLEVTLLNNLSESYYLLSKLELALENFETALQKSKKYELRAIESFILDGLGNTHNRLGNFKQAIDYQQQSLELAEQSGDQQSKINALMGLGDAHLGLENPQIAIKHYIQSLKLSSEIKQPKTAYEAHQKLADAYQKIGDLPKAIEHLREYHKLEREVLSQETAQKTKNLSLQFDLERARHEAEVYRVQNEAIERANDLLEEKVQERTRELEEARVEIVMRLALAAEYRDDSTGQHTLRVGRTSALLANSLGLPKDQTELLRSAARLHDVGKIGISDLIMLKPSKLTPKEFEVIKTHTTIGAQMLSNGQSPLLKMAELIALTHHERWDGGGYPNGLAAENIPLVGRIVAVADVFDALRSERPYKRAWSLSEARAEIETQAGKHFDARVVEVFLKLLDSGENFD